MATTPYGILHIWVELYSVVLDCQWLKVSRSPDVHAQAYSLIRSLATSVTPEGRITPEDSGLWQDSQIEPLKRTVDFAHSQGQKICIQLAHAGRKASTVAPWLASGAVAGKEVGGWPDKVYGPSAIPWNEQHAPVIAMTKQDILDFKTAFHSSIRRALQAGFDAIEIHNAH